MASLPSVQEMEQYIRASAAARGIDPDIAVRVARSEGLARDTWQSNVMLPYGRERSYGPFQLHVAPKGRKPGLGNAFVKETGLDPSDPTNWKATIDYGLDAAATGGWGPWFGAKKLGITGFDGIKGGRALGVSNNVPKDTIQPQAGYGFASSDPNYKPEINQQSGYGFGKPMGPSTVDGTGAVPGTPPMPGRDVVDVRSAADESVGDMRPSSFQQLSARQALEGDQSQIPRLMQAFGLSEDGKQRLQPRGSSPGILKQLASVGPSSNSGIMSFLSKLFG